MRNLFELTLKEFTPYSISGKLNVKKTGLTLKLAGLKGFIYWNIITFGKVRVYALYSEGKVVHTSYVVPKCYKFPFLRGGLHRDIEIGPCYTAAECRGRGYYPYVLSEIIKAELKDDQKAYMIVNKDAIASERGIKKVGFRKVSQVRKDRFKRYVVIQHLEIL